MSRRVAILGATGLVGRTMLRILEGAAWAAAPPVLLASEGGRSLPFRGRDVPVMAVAPGAFAGVDIALFAVANALSRTWAPAARAAGATVIDNSSAFRYDDDVPLVVPEINARLLESRPTLIANPNCSTAGVVMAIAPLLALARLERLVISTYQSVSGAGAEAVDQLERGIRDGLEGAPPAREGGLPPFAYNVVPQIDRFETNGYTREEMKIVWESRKILGISDLAVTATAVRVPVRVGHSAAVNAVFAPAVTPDEARAAWRAFPGLVVVDDPARGIFPTPLEAEGRGPVLVGRARADVSHPRGLEFFISSDNLLKGAALNAVQIAEALCREGEPAR